MNRFSPAPAMLSSDLDAGDAELEQVSEQEYIEGRRMSLLERENALKNLTEDAYKQVENFISIASKLEEIECEKVQLIRENEELRETLTFQLEEYNLLRTEYKKCLEYIEELHQNLNEKIADVAILEVECEKFRIEMLACKNNSIGNDSSAAEPLKNDQDYGGDNFSQSSYKLPSSAFSRIRSHDKSRDSIKKIDAFRHRANILISDHQSHSDTATSASVLKTTASSTAVTNDQKALNRLLSARLPNSHIQSLERGDRVLEETHRQLNPKENDVMSREPTFKTQKIAEHSPEGSYSMINADNNSLTGARDRTELLYLIRRHMEEKISWQTYAESLLKKIMRYNPELLNIGTTANLNNFNEIDDSIWREFALALMHKLIAHSPSLLTISTETQEVGELGKPTLLEDGSIIFPKLSRGGNREHYLNTHPNNLPSNPHKPV